MLTLYCIEQLFYSPAGASKGTLGDAKCDTEILERGAKIRTLGGNKIFLFVSRENKRIKPIKLCLKCYKNSPTSILIPKIFPSDTPDPHLKKGRSEWKKGRRKGEGEVLRHGCRWGVGLLFASWRYLRVKRDKLAPRRTDNPPVTTVILSLFLSEKMQNLVCIGENVTRRKWAI